MEMKVSIKRHGRKRLSIDIPISLHNELKVRSIAHECSLTAYIIRALIEKLNSERSRGGKHG
jgi:hypothetical protein